MGPAPPPRHENDLLEGDRLPNLRGWEFRRPSRVTPRLQNFSIVLRILADGHRTSPRCPPTEPHHLFRGGHHRREGASHPPRTWVPPPSTGMAPCHMPPRVTCPNQTKRYPTARGNRERGCYGCVSAICGGGVWGMVIQDN